MTLFEIPVGTHIFIDTNILIYAGSGSQECRSLLEGCSSGVFQGYISQIVLSEFCHRRMVQEARIKAAPERNTVKWLAEHPSFIKKLDTYSDDVATLLKNDLQVIEITSADIRDALNFQRSFGLLTNDSLQLTAMFKAGLTNIASADKAFNHIPHILVYCPSNLTGLKSDDRP